MKNYLASKFLSYLDSINFEDKGIIEVIKTKDVKFGDYTSNIAMRLTKTLGKNPMEIAEDIKTYLEANNEGDFVEVTVTNPGFVNLFLTKKLLVKTSMMFIDENYKPEFKYIKPLKINYEYVSANPTGDLHIGHARNAIVGNSTINALKYVGHNVRTEYWINDAGVQMTNLAESVYWFFAPLVGLKFENLTDNAVSYKGEEIEDYGKQLATEGFMPEGANEEERIESMILKCGEHFLNNIKDLLKNGLKIQEFDNWQSEKWTLENKFGPVFEDLKSKGYVYEKENAIWVKSSDYGDEKDRVIIKSDGTYTYMAADVAYHTIKYDNGNMDLLIDLWGKDHHGYEPRMQAALKAAGLPEGKLEVDYISMVKVMKGGKEFKMSKRAGTSLRIKDILKEMDSDVFKYFLVSKTKEQNMIIDIEEITKQDMSNPYYYVQYANARMNQIIEKYKSKIGNVELIKEFKLLGVEESEKALMAKMVEFEDVMITMEKEREPSLILNYQKELAQVFNTFYAACKVVDPSNKEVSLERLNLVIALKNQFKTIFNIMSITPVEKIINKK